MPTKDLNARYGPAKSRVLLGRAVRAEEIGGDDLLDAIQALDRLKHKLAKHKLTRHLDATNQALEITHGIYTDLRANVRQRYGMPPESDDR